MPEAVFVHRDSLPGIHLSPSFHALQMSHCCTAMFFLLPIRKAQPMLLPPLHPPRNCAQLVTCHRASSSFFRWLCTG